MTLNASVPRFECLVRDEFLYNMGREHTSEFSECTVFGVASLQGRALGFHVLIHKTGAVIWRLPIHALAWKECDRQDLVELELWDCFSYQVAVTEFEHLSEMRVLAYLGENGAFPGAYMFTVDWYGNVYAEDAGPGGHKCAHIIKLDNGNYCAQPNNRLSWHEPSQVGLDASGTNPKPDYTIMTRTWKCEDKGWRTSDDDRYMYEMKGSDLDDNGGCIRDKKSGHMVHILGEYGRGGRRCIGCGLVVPIPNKDMMGYGSLVREVGGIMEEVSPGRGGM